MLILDPARVTLGASTFEDVEAVAIGRVAARAVVEHTEGGPHAMFADVPEQRVVVTITRRLDRSHGLDLSPGQALELAVSLSLEASDAGRTVVRALCVLLESRHELAAAAAGKGGVRARQVLMLLAISPDGVTDPVTVAD